jgi:hypothetical protein
VKLRRIALVISATLLAVAALLVASNTRVPILRGAGQLLIADESPVDRVDAVVVAIDAGTAGLLEAADLVHGGVTARVATFVSAPGRADLELLARGVPFEDMEAKYRRQLYALGVASVVPIPMVTNWRHSRRVKRVLERAMEGHPTKVTVRVVRHSRLT